MSFVMDMTMLIPLVEAILFVFLFALFIILIPIIVVAYLIFPKQFENITKEPKECI